MKKMPFLPPPFYKGFGGIDLNKRHLLGLEFFTSIDPMIWDELACYIDPVEGLLFGDAMGCEPTGTSNLRCLEKI